MENQRIKIFAITSCTDISIYLFILQNIKNSVKQSLFIKTIKFTKGASHSITTIADENQRRKQQIKINIYQNNYYNFNLDKLIFIGTFIRMERLNI